MRHSSAYITILLLKDVFAISIRSYHLNISTFRALSCSVQPWYRYISIIALSSLLI